MKYSKKSKKNAITSLLLIAFFLSMISSSSAIPISHETLIIQIEDTVINIDNRYRSASSLYDSVVAYQYQGYLGMIAPGETIVTLPGIAESWTVNEDLNEWTFNIREGAKMHDGAIIDAKTVKYSMEASYMAYYNLNNMSQARAEYVSDAGLNINFPASDPNGDGLVVTFSGDWFPDPMFEFDICGSWKFFTLVPLNSHGTYQDTTEVCQTKYETFTEAPLSAGPYMFSEWVQEDYVLLERFDDWFGWGQTLTGSNGKDYKFPDVNDAFKFVKYRIITEESMAVVELRTGGVDVTTCRFSSDTSLKSVNDTEGYSAYKLATLGGATMQTNIQGDWPSYFGGPGNFPVSEDWFRKAVSHAINRTNIVDNVYLGIADERDTIFPDWILDKFPNIDASDYYDFDQGVFEAEALFDAAGYSALGFADEPDNRFGWGIYANETSINAVEQTRGRHFVLTTMDCDFCIKRALAVQKDLKQVGIYINTEILDYGQYLDALYEGDPGFDYNSTSPQPDTAFEGPHWDFTVGGFGGNYETPWDFIAYQTFAYWLFYGYGGYGWFDIDYEVAYAKATDGRGLLGYYDESPSDYPYPAPVWSNENLQFIQACEDAGYLMSQAMNKIPLVWYVDTYAFNDHVINFLAARDSLYHVAYSYWGDTTGVTTETTAGSSDTTGVTTETTAGSSDTTTETASDNPTTQTIPNLTSYLEIYYLIGLSVSLLLYSRKSRK